MSHASAVGRIESEAARSRCANALFPLHAYNRPRASNRSGSLFSAIKVSYWAMAPARLPDQASASAYDRRRETSCDDIDIACASNRALPSESPALECALAASRTCESVGAGVAVSSVSNDAAARP